ncbi:hypothetical protein TNCV_2803051 [Trichonephila clavipes]|nr:hypothetical protein TNCV_2803051 [Trichonephila clavipes]
MTQTASGKFNLIDLIPMYDGGESLGIRRFLEKINDVANLGKRARAGVALIPEKPAEPERPADPERPPLEDSSVFMDNAKVIPPLITRCDKCTQTLSPSFHVQRLDLGKRRMEPPLAPKRLKQEPSEGSNNIILWVPRHHPLMQLGHNGFLIQPTNVNGINK